MNFLFILTSSILFAGVLSTEQQLTCNLQVKKMIKIENMNMLCIHLDMTAESRADNRRKQYKIVDKNIEVQYTLNDEIFNVNLSNSICYERIDRLSQVRNLHLCGNVQNVQELSNIVILTDKLKLQKNRFTLSGEEYSFCNIQKSSGYDNERRRVAFNNPGPCTHDCRSLTIGDGEDMICPDPRNSQVSRLKTAADVNRLVQITPEKALLIPRMNSLCVEMVLKYKTRGIASVQISSKEHLTIFLQTSEQTKQLDNLSRNCKDTNYRWNSERNSEMVCLFYNKSENFDQGKVILNGSYSLRYTTLSHLAKVATVSVNTSWNVSELIKNIQPSNLVCPTRCSQSCEPTCSTLIYGNGHVLCHGYWKSVTLEGSNFNNYLKQNDQGDIDGPDVVERQNIPGNPTPTTKSHGHSENLHVTPPLPTTISHTRIPAITTPMPKSTPEQHVRIPAITTPMPKTTPEQRVRIPAITTPMPKTTPEQRVRIPAITTPVPKTTPEQRVRISASTTQIPKRSTHHVRISSSITTPFPSKKSSTLIPPNPQIIPEAENFPTSLPIVSTTTKTFSTQKTVNAEIEVSSNSCQMLLSMFVILFNIYFVVDNNV